MLKVSSINNNVSFLSSAKTAENLPDKKTNDKKSFDSKKLALALACTATVALAGIALAKKNKLPDDTLTLSKFKNKGFFDKGTAKLKDGSNYTGKIFIKGKEANTTLEYTDGLIQTSIREFKKASAPNEIGKVATKTYEYAPNGSKMITEINARRLFFPKK